MSQIQIQHRSAPTKPGASLNVNPVLARVLAHRGVASAADLDYGLKRLLPPGGLMHIDQAADLLAEAVTAQASIVVVGDFDADGATSCAVAVKSLQAFGLQSVSYLVPNRFEYGYGLSPEIVGMAALRQPDIIVTVDNGISSIDGVHAAQALGMSVLVTDHHLPGEQLPTADVIVNPNLPGDGFASKNLAGVGVIFYVMLAVRARLRQANWFAQSGISEPNMSQFLDLVALGTVADVVPLDKNNRLLVQQGLQRIRQGLACPGVQALLTVGKRNPQRAVASDLGFAAGPRLNAAGRLDDMSLGIECLLSPDLDQAMRLATQLDELNRERRAVEQSMQDDALQVVAQVQLDQTSLPDVLVLHDESWHQGVVGLVASRLKERFYRPVIALAPGDNEGEWKGSCRSVDGVHIRDFLARIDALHPGLMSKFGGHAMAAGLSVNQAKLAEFERVVTTVAQEFTKDKDWQQVLHSDGELKADEFSLAIAQELRESTPWGQSFPEPLFDGQFQVLDKRIVGDKHLKLRVQVPGGPALDAICFFYLDRYEDLPGESIRAAFKLDINDFRDQLSLQLLIEHIEF